MRKVLKNTLKNKEYLNHLPTIYLVGCWAKCGVREYHFTGKYEQDENGISIPLVYDYDDHNGTCDNWYLRRLDHVTTGQIIMWTQRPSIAFEVAKLFNKELEDKWNTSD